MLVNIGGGDEMHKNQIHSVCPRQICRIVIEINSNGLHSGSMYSCWSLN
jgi:hypothetical protein